MNSEASSRSISKVYYSRIELLKEDKAFSMEKLCAFFLVLTPILQHYKGPLMNAGVSILILFFPFILMKLLYKMRKFKPADLGVVVMLIVFSLYKVVDHGPSFYDLAHGILIIAYYMAIALGCIKVKHLVKSAYYVAVGASVCIILQYIFFYAFGFHLQLSPTSLLLPGSSRWILGAQTGVAGSLRNLYRPSAFFLEPSHMFLYIFPHLFMMLLSLNSNRRKIRRALLFTLALLLSTSGMGIAVAASAWALFLGLSSGKDNIIRLKYILKPRNMLILMVLFIFLIGVYFTVPVFTKSIDRIIGGNPGSNAISGRTTRSITLIKRFTGTKLLFGVSDPTYDIEFNMPGFMGTIYLYGLIGTVLSYGFYVRGLFKLKAEYFWISFVIILVSFFSAHTHGTFYMLYYVIILLEGNNQLRMPKSNSLVAQIPR
jgi:hypothetical protein